MRTQTLDPEAIGGIVSIGYFGQRGPIHTASIAVYGDRDFRKRTLERLEKQGYRPANMTSWFYRRFGMPPIGRPIVSQASLKEGVNYVGELASEYRIETDPRNVGIGIGVLLEMQQHPDVEKPVATLTQLWAD